MVSPAVLAAISGSIAGTLAVVVVAVSQRLGGTLGGLLASVPSIVVVASVGLAYELDDADKVRDAMMSAPSSGFMTTMYIVAVWVWLPPRLPERWQRLSVIGVIALLTWLSFTVPWVLFVYPEIEGLGIMQDDGYRLSQAVGFLWVTYVFATLAGTGLQIPAKNVENTVSMPEDIAAHESLVRPPSVNSWRNDGRGVGDDIGDRGPAPFSLKLLALRFGVGFTIVFLAVYLGKLDKIVGAALSVFPGLGTANQFLLWHSNGMAMVRDLSKSMAVGYIGVYVYAVLFGIMIPTLGVWPAAGAAWGVSFVGVSVPMYFAMR